MAMNTRVIDNYKVIAAAPPQSYSGVAMTAYYVSLKYFNHCTILIQTGAWAGSTAAVSLTQATTIAAGTNKALAFTKMWVNTAAAQDTYTETAVVSNTFNLGTAALSYVIEVDAATLDIDNGYCCLTATIGSPSSNADFYCVYYLLSGSRFPSAPLTMPTALTT